MEEVLSTPADNLPEVAPSQIIHVESPTPVILSELSLGVNLLLSQDLSKSNVFSPTGIALGLSSVDDVNTLCQQLRTLLIEGSSAEQLRGGQVSQGILKRMNGNVLVLVNHSFHCDENLSMGLSKESATNLKDWTAASETINAHVAKKTDGNIVEVVKQEEISSDLQMFLINAIHFEARCRGSSCFPKETRRIFYKSFTEPRTVPFLTVTNTMRYSFNEDFEVVSSNHVLGSNYILSIFLPRKDFGLKDALKNIEAVDIKELMDSGYERHTAINFPKFEKKSKFDFKDVMGALKIDSENQDSSKIGMSFATSFEVDKYRPKAGVRWAYRTNDAPAEKPFEFKVNHPFMYVIAKEGHPIVMGTYH